MNPRRALVLYASQTGTAEDLALQLSTTLERHRFAATTLSCDDLSPLSSLPTHPLIFLVVSTTGQGEIPDNAKTFWRGLLRKKIPPTWLAGVSFAVFCLGDSTYPKFCWAGRKVGRRLLQLGATEVVGRGEGDQSGNDGIEGAWVHWVDELRRVLRGLWPLPEGVEEIPEDVVLPSKWVLEFADSDTPMEVDGWKFMRELHTPRPGAVLAFVEKNERITPAAHWQDVRHLTFSLPSPASWEPGDTLSICPKNFPEDVGLFLSLQGWTHLADRPLIIKPAPHTDPTLLPSCPIPYPVSPLTLRTLLTHHLDITAIPRQSFFALAAHLTTDELHRERLQEFADPQWVEELWDYTTRPRRSLLEVLQEFGSVNITLDRLLELVPRLRERHFSIASSSLRDNTTTDLLIAIVKYKTVIKKIRQGVCTRFLGSLNPGETVAVRFHQGSLRPLPLEKPVVLIAPGTGVAPMRALLQQRRARGGRAGDILIFGCRNRGNDFFFWEEWEEMVGEGWLRLFPAFSRDQREKRYVQTVVAERGEDVWNTLGRENGAVFVCGSSGRMPLAVREALVGVFRKWGGLRREGEAEAMLGELKRGGRYWQETW